MTRRGALVTLALLALTLVAAWFLLVRAVRCGLPPGLRLGEQRLERAGA